MSEEQDKRIAELEKDLYGTQEMLAAVLFSVGEPVVVTKEQLVTMDRNAQIEIKDDVQKDAFTFSLVSK